MRFLMSALIIAVSACSPAAEAPPPVAPSASDVQAPLPWASPADVGVSAEGLELIGPAMQQWVDDGRVAGVVTMVARRGQLVHWNAVGVRDLESGEPLEIDDIFRIFSMTKPITSVAAMMLVEEGMIALDDPVSRYLPAFADVQVYNDGDLIAANRPITVEDLLRHTSGLVYFFLGSGGVYEQYSEAGLNDAADLAEHVDILATLPLVDHPGARWHYGRSTNVLARIVEVVSGQPLDDFFEARILAPLGMADTGFFVPPAKHDRVMSLYFTPAPGGPLELSPANWIGLEDPALLAGDAGLMSTASDYLRFAQMFLNDGELEGVRLLKPETVALMRSNRIDEEFIPIRLGPSAFPGYGFGLGGRVLVDKEATPIPDNNGVFRWVGIGSTYFWIDPEAELIGIVMTQFIPEPLPRFEAEFEALVYGALQD